MTFKVGDQVVWGRDFRPRYGDICAVVGPGQDPNKVANNLTSVAATDWERSHGGDGYQQPVKFGRPRKRVSYLVASWVSGYSGQRLFWPYTCQLSLGRDPEELRVWEQIQANLAKKESAAEAERLNAARLSEVC